MSLALFVAAAAITPTLTLCRGKKYPNDWAQSEYTRCSWLERNDANDRLRSILASAIRRARKHDLDNLGTLLPKLEKAQRAWHDYRKAHCAFEEGLYLGGSAHLQSFYVCETNLTKARIAQLQEFVSD